MKSGTLTYKILDKSILVFNKQDNGNIRIHCHYIINGGETLLMAVNSLLIQDDNYSKHFDTVEVVWTHCKHTISPDEWIANASVVNLFHKLLQPDRHEKLAFQAINNSGISIVFTIDKRVEEAFRDSFPNVVHTHDLAKVIKTQSKVIEEEVGICLDNGLLYISGYKYGKLQFANSFVVHSATDILYYILLAYRFSGLDPHRHKLLIQSGIMSDSQAGRLLDTYLGSIRYL